MAVYKGPVKDITFVLNEVLDVSSLAKLPGYEDATPDTIQAILEEAAKLCENVLFPLNRTGDEEGCHYENGVVRTPKGFKEAYDQFREGGWTAVTWISTSLNSLMCASRSRRLRSRSVMCSRLRRSNSRSC